MLITFLVLTLIIVITMFIHPEITRDAGGKIFAFVALCVFPALGAVGGVSEHLENSKRTEFCLSCHPMQRYGQSLLIDDPEYIPAIHFQDNLIPREKACYTCHTDYTMFGDVNSKLRGMKHLLIHYFGDTPDTIHLYNPYNNRECLHCHSGMRRFEENAVHSENPRTLDSLKNNTLSCLSSGCHEAIHDVHDLESMNFWKDSTIEWEVKAK